MNDNKRLYKKLTTWFWWLIATLPIIMLLGYFLYYIFNKNNNSGFDLNNSIESVYYNFDNMTESSGILFNKLYSMFLNLFRLFGITDNFTDNMFVGFMIYSLSWFILVHILHLIVDIILLLPRICQRFIERV